MRPSSSDPAFISEAKEQPLVDPPAIFSNKLAGLRLAVKDLFHINGLTTSAGNPDWLTTHTKQEQTHECITKILSNGAQYVGKTLTDELAYSLNGQNMHYPKLLNPITPNRLVGGSSSGSAAAVAANAADIGLGTDTGGSIRVPASYNGLFGLRPTHGKITCENMVGLAPSFDTVGWMTRSIEVMLKVSETVLRPHDIDNTSATMPLQSILVLENLVQQSEQGEQINHWIQNVNQQTINKYKFDVEQLNTSETFRILQGHEIWKLHGEWIMQTQPTFANDVLERLNWCRTLTQSDAEKARAQREVIENTINDLFKEHKYILMPTTPGRAPLLSTSGQQLTKYRNQLMSLTSIAGLTGRPQIHLPIFEIDGAPCGLSLIGEKHSDLSLIQFAKTLFTDEPNKNQR